MVGKWDMTLPLLKFMADSTDGTITTWDARVFLVNTLDVSQEEQDERMKGGHNKFKNMVRWAILDMKFAGLISWVSRGTYEITNAGRKMVEQEPPRIDFKYLVENTNYLENLRRAKEGGSRGSVGDQLNLGEVYSRKKLEEMFDTSGWGFDTGVFVPRTYRSIWLFVTEMKSLDRTQYYDLLRGDVLDWDGQMSGRTDDKIINHKSEGNELLLFYRETKETYPEYGFRYEGAFEYISHSGSNPTHFLLRRSSSLKQQVQDDVEGFLEEHEFTEGRKTMRYSSRYERDPRLREAAIRHHGTRCMVCGFDFEVKYGPHGTGYIEVHHIAPLSESHEETSVNPETDTAVLCANCHRMIHRRRSYVLSVDELKVIVERNQLNQEKKE